MYLDDGDVKLPAQRAVVLPEVGHDVGARDEREGIGVEEHREVAGPAFLPRVLSDCGVSDFLSSHIQSIYTSDFLSIGQLISRQCIYICDCLSTGQLMRRLLTFSCTQNLFGS